MTSVAVYGRTVPFQRGDLERAFEAAAFRLAVGELGGGVYMEQKLLNPPANLLMNRPVSTGKDGIPPYQCTPNITGAEGYSRQWEYTNAKEHREAVLLIEGSIIDHNSAGTADKNATDTVDENIGNQEQVVTLWR